MDFQPRAICRRCLRPARVCWCDRLTPLHSRTRVCFLQHPREGRVPIGTARMAHLSLPNSELHRGVEFGAHARVRALASGGGAALLFPGEGALEPAQLGAAAPRTLIVVDGTWAQARKVVRRNAFLHALPRIGLRPARPSNYRIRREPAAHCVSTIEAVVQVLGELEGDEARFEPLLRAFERMVDLQVEHASARPGPERVRRKASRAPRPDEGLLQLRARRGNLVALYAEANAHARPRPGEATPPSVPPGEAELIQLAAARPGSGETFAALIAPRRPLSPGVPGHLSIPAARILSGEELGAALRRFRAFLRQGDVLCGWGGYAVDLLAACGEPARPFLDVRLVAARLLRRKPGGVEQALRVFGGAEASPLGEGRAGARIAALASLIERLLAPGLDAAAHAEES